MTAEKHALAESTAYFEGEELSAKVFVDKYSLRNSNDEVIEMNPDQMHRRMAKEFARVEAKKFQRPLSEDEIYELFRDFGPIIPQGSPMYGIGNPQYISLSNCFVIEPPQDSYAGILFTDEQLVQICKRRGGVGTDLSHLRPAGFATTNSARTSTGIVPFAQRYSNSICEVGQNGRRGALMLTISVHHPQVLDFARMKLDSKSVTGANVSIRLSDEFLSAVEKDETYEQRWPVEGESKFSRRVKAREVWNEIVRCARERAEPGLLFWDAILRESPADCYADDGFRTVSTNPCSELPLCVLDSCRLLLLNLFCFVNNPFRPNAKFNWKRFRELAIVAQRLMDDLVDLELEAIDRILRKVASDPENFGLRERELTLWQRVRDKCSTGRRTGTGITALADAMAALGIRYGTDGSIQFTEKVYRELKLACYRSSVDMAKELGAFPIWDPDKEKDCPFLLRIRDEDPALYADMQKYGRRNISLLTTAPAGSVSIVAGPRPYFQTTSGIEPLFEMCFVRKKKINHSDKDARVDSVDENGNKWQHFTVYHPKLRMWMDVTGETDISKSPYAGCCAEELEWKQRVRLQAAATKHVDHAISSTLNLPEDVTVEKVAEIYTTAWRSGCKGITVYRKNCRSGVLVSAEKKTEQYIPQTDAPKRPEDLPCDIHFTKVKGEQFFVTVGKMGQDPYEVFAGRREGITGTSDGAFTSYKEGVLRKVKRGKYQLLVDDDFVLIANVAMYASDEQEALTRMVSTALRHGADIAFVVEQLAKVKGDMSSFAKAISRTLKKYVPDGHVISGSTCEACGQDTLVFQEGCQRCKNCSWSKCG